MSDVIVHDSAGVREVRLDRPAKRNALTRAMYAAMADALSGAAAAGMRAIWLHGSAACFTAGNDLVDFAQAAPGQPSAALAFLAALVGCDTPVVASVNGAAVGIGTTLLLHCDLAYCSAEARFQLPFVNLGLCPEGASSLLLPARAGLLQASALLLLGEPFDAATALACGIVNAVLPDAAAADAMGRRRAEALAAKPPDALRTTRMLLRGRQRAAITEALREEGAAFARLLQGPEAREALAAFQEKRAPDFSALPRTGPSAAD
ncbi:MAG: enoyl-CoA hydratase-related protein [Acetobacteraceae bacterium]